MIVNWFLGVLQTVVHGLLSLMPTVAVPSWLQDSSSIGWLVQQVNALSNWFPVGLAVTVFGAVLTCVGVGFAIKVVRIVASFVTAGGGSAG